MTPDQQAEQAVQAGMTLVGIVRDYGRDTITENLAGISRGDLERMAVALAAMVPDDRTPAQLLAWCDPDAVQRNAATRRREQRRKAAVLRQGQPLTRPEHLQPCGTHSAFNRHKAAGEQPCDLCVAGERLYQRERARRRRALKQQAA